MIVGVTVTVTSPATVIHTVHCGHYRNHYHDRYNDRYRNREPESYPDRNKYVTLTSAMSVTDCAPCPSLRRSIVSDSPTTPDAVTIRVIVTINAYLANIGTFTETVIDGLTS